MWRIFLPIFVASGIAIAFTLFMGQGDMWWLSCMATLFAGLKLMMSNRIPHGWAVSGKPVLLGMPRFLAVFYMIILGLTIMLGFTWSGSLLDATNYRFQALGLGLFLGWLTALLDWYTFSSKETYYFSVVAERMTLKARGFSDDEIEKLIEEGYRKGFFHPK